eukprot:166443_1
MCSSIFTLYTVYFIAENPFKSVLFNGVSVLNIICVLLLIRIAVTGYRFESLQYLQERLWSEQKCYMRCHLSDVHRFDVDDNTKKKETNIAIHTNTNMTTTIYEEKEEESNSIHSDIDEKKDDKAKEKDYFVSDIVDQQDLILKNVKLLMNQVTNLNKKKSDYNGTDNNVLIDLKKDMKELKQLKEISWHSY